MGQETRIDQKTGKIYTEKEWNDHCYIAYQLMEETPGLWDELTPIKLIPGKEDEIREKMLFIYSKPDLYKGDIITDDIDRGEMFIVEGVTPTMINVRSITSHLQYIWTRYKPWIRIENING